MTLLLGALLAAGMLLIAAPWLWPGGRTPRARSPAASLKLRSASSA